MNALNVHKLMRYNKAIRLCRFALERTTIMEYDWANAPLITSLIVFCLIQFVFYSLVPVVLLESGATALQLALLTSDFFNVLFGMLTRQYKVRANWMFVQYSQSSLDRCLNHTKFILYCSFIRSTFFRTSW